MISGALALSTLISAQTLQHPSPALAEDPYIVPGRLLVQFDNGAQPQSLPLSGGRSALTRRASSASGPNSPAVYSVPAGRENELASELRRTSGVKIAEPDYRVFSQVTPNDPQYSSQWALPKINAPAAWDVTTGSASVIIAALDTGVDRTHPEFAGRLLTGYDFVNNDADPTDDNGHGTHVAGIAAGAGNNGVGIAGVAWGATILPVKVLDSQGGGSTADVIKGIDFAIDQKARIINLSLGSPFPSASLQSAITRAMDAGILIVAAAGNCGAGGDGCPSVNSPLYPAAFSGVLAVGATTQSDAKASFSTAGSYVAVTAPGSAILSTYKDGGYRTISGTSMASPFVAGEAALLLSRDPSLSASDLKAAISAAVVDLGATGRDDLFGTGRIDLQKALAAVQPPSSLAATPGRVVFFSPSSLSVPVSITSTGASGISFVATAGDNWVRVNGASTFTGTAPSTLSISVTGGVTTTRESVVNVSSDISGVGPLTIEVVYSPLARQVFVPIVPTNGVTSW